MAEGNGNFRFEHKIKIDTSNTKEMNYFITSVLMDYLKSEFNLDAEIGFVNESGAKITAIEEDYVKWWYYPETRWEPSEEGTDPDHYYDIDKKEFLSWLKDNITTDMIEQLTDAVLSDFRLYYDMEMERADNEY